MKELLVEVKKKESDEGCVEFSITKSGGKVITAALPAKLTFSILRSKLKDSRAIYYKAAALYLFIIAALTYLFSTLHLKYPSVSEVIWAVLSFCIGWRMCSEHWENHTEGTSEIALEIIDEKHHARRKQ